MVKLVDTLVSGTSARKGVEVRVLFRAKKKPVPQGAGFFFILRIDENLRRVRATIGANSGQDVRDSTRRRPGGSRHDADDQRVRVLFRA